MIPLAKLQIDILYLNVNFRHCKNNLFNKGVFYIDDPEFRLFPASRHLKVQIDCI